MTFLTTLVAPPTQQFTDIVTQVMILSNRPELVAEHQSAVLSATFELHAADNWWPDRTETIIPAAQVPTANSSIILEDYLPRLRVIEAIRPFDSANGNTVGRDAKMPTLEPITPSSLFDEFMSQKQEYFYLAGLNLIVRTRNYGNPLYVSYFAHASASSVGSYYSWIATKYPWAIINKAFAKISTATGNEETAQRLMRNDCVTDLQYLRQNYIANP